MKNTLNTFIFVSGNRALSPALTTVREYARWLENVFDEYTCNYELYIRATVGDTKVLEFHPGTRIGQYFDNTEFTNNKYNSWYVYRESNMMSKLANMKLASYKDIAPTLSGQHKGLKLLRLYSVDQLELYIRTKIDKTFNIGNYLTTPKKIVLRRKDFNDIVIPQVKSTRKSLLDKPVPMTVFEIERQLGHKVSIIS